jgi:CBS-domain-containing membrane protein
MPKELKMSKKTRDVMTPGRPPGCEFSAGSIGADDFVDEALRSMMERHADRLAVLDGQEIIGTVTPGELAISIEDTRTWSALCK